MRTSTQLTTPPFVADRSSLTQRPGIQIDWNMLDDTYRAHKTGDVVVQAANADATTVNLVTALTFDMPVGTVLYFAADKFARLTEPYYAGETSITVQALVTALILNDTAVYNAYGPKKLRAGTVIGNNPRARTTDATVAADAGNTGNGVLTMLAGAKTGSDVEAGVYTLTCIAEASNAGVFSVVSPSGEVLASATVAVAYRGSHIQFTIADGAEDFNIGDIIRITVAHTDVAIGTAGKASPRSANNPAIGILLTDALEGDKSAALSGYGMIVGGVLYENLLPDAAGNPKQLSVAVKRELNEAGTGFTFVKYEDNRS